MITLILIINMLYAIRPPYIARSDIISSQNIDVPDSLLSVDTLKISIAFKIDKDGSVKKVWMRYDTLDTIIWNKLEKYLINLKFTQPKDCNGIVRDSSFMGVPIKFY